MSTETAEDIVQKILKLDAKQGSLNERRRNRILGKQLLQLLPQGHGSGLNADMLDDFHVEDIIKEALRRVASIIDKRILRASGGGGAGMSKHGNEFHTPHFSEATHSHTATIKTTLSFAVVATLTTGTDKAPTIMAPCSLTITKAKVVVKTAPTGSSIIVDINKAGTTIFTNQANRPEIAIGETQDDSGTPDVTSLSEGDKVTIDIDQVGSGTPGADLTVEVVCTQNVEFS